MNEYLKIALVALLVAFLYDRYIKYASSIIHLTNKKNRLKKWT